jgi:hypothetical protein
MNVKRLLFSKDKSIASCCNVSSGQIKVSTIANQIDFGVKEVKSSSHKQQKAIIFH